MIKRTEAIDLMNVETGEEYERLRADLGGPIVRVEVIATTADGDVTRVAFPAATATIRTISAQTPTDPGLVTSVSGERITQMRITTDGLAYIGPHQPVTDEEQ